MKRNKPVIAMEFAYQAQSLKMPVKSFFIGFHQPVQIQDISEGKSCM